MGTIFLRRFKCMQHEQFLKGWEAVENEGIDFNWKSSYNCIFLFQRSFLFVHWFSPWTSYCECCILLPTFGRNKTHILSEKTRIPIRNVILLYDNAQSYTAKLDQNLLWTTLEHLPDLSRCDYHLFGLKEALEKWRFDDDCYRSVLAQLTVTTIFILR